MIMIGNAGMPIALIGGIPSLRSAAAAPAAT
jgi:hypothetical protein